MLGRLLNLASGAPPGPAASGLDGPPQPVSSLESVQEDVHTRGLLFPDAHVLHQHRHDQMFPLTAGSSLSAPPTGNPFDYDGELDLEPRDVRVIIMQDALGSMTASLLYDSQPAPAPPPPGGDLPSRRGSGTGSSSQPIPLDQRRTPISPRKSSLGPSSRPLIIQPDNPQLRLGALDRRAQTQGRTQTSETDSQRAWREYRDELATFSSCIFGNSELMAYKGTSTKVHVVPTEHRASEYSTSIIGDGRGSIGRSSVRSSRLAQSFSSDNVAPFRVSTPSLPAGRQSERRKILVTRLFPVTIPTDEEVIVSPQTRFYEDSTGYPFPTPGDQPKAGRKKPHLKQKRTPMYAVALIITLPPAPSQPTSSSVKPINCHKPGSYTEQDSFPSSFSSARRAGWTMVGPSASTEPLDVSFGGDLEDRMETITQRWDVIMRTLTHLQSVVATNLYAMLKQADVVSPDPMPGFVSSHVSRTPSLSGRRSEDGSSFKPPKSNAKLLSLLPNCLMDDTQVRSAVGDARTRLVAGLRAIRVVSGQNRWGIWREEARWIEKWAGGRDHELFFFNLLTGFLATHVEWLQALSPTPYRKRYLAQQKAKSEEDTAVRARTVIVAEDKMAARRIVFLLSAFLPANQQAPTVRPHRLSTSASFVAFSQSPPSYSVPILKEEPLRRRINRRTAPHRSSHSRNASLQGQAQAARVVGSAAGHLSEDFHHARRPSDAGSFKTADLPFPGSDSTARKSSAATTATITPETSIPHFSTNYRRESFQSARPGSSGSMAADDLKRSLARGDSIGQYSTTSTDSRQTSRWGSVLSGFLASRRRESTGTSAPSRESTAPLSPTSRAKPRANTPPKVIKEADIVESPTGGHLNPLDKDANAGSLAALERPAGGEAGAAAYRAQPSRAQQPADPSGLFDSPVKTSVNVDDGVIDVDVPLLDYMASFESAVSSPSSSGYLSTPGLGSGLDTFEQACRVSVDGDTPLNVAGWLQRFHPDFVLQATPPQPGLRESIKDALRAEPSPGLSSAAVAPQHQHLLLAESPQLGRWMDVSSALIADATNFTVTRIRYRRLVRPKPTAAASNRGSAILSSSANTYNSVLLTPAISPFEMQVEEDFQEDRVVALDDVLTEAVERVMALGGPDVVVGGGGGSGGRPSRDINIHNESSSSAGSSRSASKQPTRQPRDRSNSASTGSATAGAAPGSETPDLLGHGPLPPPPDGLHEVSRAQCKTVLLSALEEIARDVASRLEVEEGRDDGSVGGGGGGDDEDDNEDDAGEGGGVGEGVPAAAGKAKESWLQEAVRNWLKSVELGD